MEATGSGCAWIDYNNDGLLDLYVVSGRYIDGVTNFPSPMAKTPRITSIATTATAPLPTSPRKPAWAAKDSAWA